MRLNKKISEKPLKMTPVKDISDVERFRSNLDNSL